jgi:hypothetical protein
LVFAIANTRSVETQYAFCRNAKQLCEHARCRGDLEPCGGEGLTNSSHIGVLADLYHSAARQPSKEDFLRPPCAGCCAVGLRGRALLRQVCADLAIAAADVTKNHATTSTGPTHNSKWYPSVMRLP